MKGAVMKNCQDCNTLFSPEISHLAEEGLKQLSLAYCPTCRTAYNLARAAERMPGLSPETRKTLETVATAAVFVGGGYFIAQLLKPLFSSGSKRKRRK